MVRSINIERTDQLVWKMIKGILQQIRDGSPTASTLADLERSDLDDRAGFLTDGITWMSPEQIDLLSDEEKRIVVSKAVSSITATFDVETKKHCLDVAIKEVIARQLADVMGRSRRSSDRVVLTPSERVSEGSSLVMDVSGDACDDLSIGQQQLSDRARSFGDGGVGLLGPAPQSPGSESPKALIVSSGPVTLDIRPLSDYQRQLIDAILKLRLSGWSDRQIANHFNETGYLTPRGRRWLPQSVFSMRTKLQRRLVRVGS
jgi:hypothetical protein